MFLEPIDISYPIIEERVVQENPLQAAIAREDILAVRTLLACRADVHDLIHPLKPLNMPGDPIYPDEPALPLDFAAQTGNTEIIQLLLDHGADVNYHKKLGYHASALWYAVRTNKAEAAYLLIQNGAEIAMDGPERKYYCPIPHAVRTNNIEMFKIVVDHIADLRPYLGDDEVMQTVFLENAEMLEIMLDKGIPANYLTDEGQTPLMGARGKCLDLLLERGADVQVKAKDGFTPIMWTSMTCDVESAAKLIQRGALVDEPWLDPEGYTPFYNACCFTSDFLDPLPYLQLLLDAGADINKRCENGFTPLGKLRWGQHPEIESWLIAHGAKE